MPRSKPPYPPEFRREALELLRLSGKPVSQIAKDLDVSEQTLYVWRRQADIDADDARASPQRSARSCVPYARRTAT